jgi:hypothetical protein
LVVAGSLAVGDRRRLAGPDFRPPAASGCGATAVYYLSNRICTNVLYLPNGCRVLSIAEPKEIRMRVVVDHDRCEGNAFCVNIAPKVFQLDDDEYAWR